MHSDDTHFPGAPGHALCGVRETLYFSKHPFWPSCQECLIAEVKRLRQVVDHEERLIELAESRLIDVPTETGLRAALVRGALLVVHPRHPACLLRVTEAGYVLDPIAR